MTATATPQTGRRRRPTMAIGAFTSLLICMVLWGPPRLRLVDRAANVALENPLDLDAAAIFQLAVLGAGCIATIGCLVRLSDRAAGSLKSLLRGPLGWYAALSGFALLSAVYSVQPPYTAYFATKLIVVWALPALTVARKGLPTAEAILRYVRVVFTCQALLVLSLAAILPDVVGQTISGAGYRLTGGTFDDFGYSATIGLIFAAAGFTVPQRRWRRALLLTLVSLLLVHLVMARTRIMLIGAAAACIVTLATRRPRRAAALAAALAIGGAALTLTPDSISGGLQDYARRGQTDSEIGSGSGRVQAFQFLLDVWKENPIAGSGYAAGTRVNLLRFMTEYGLGIGAGHDVVSTSLAELGALGLLIVSALYVSVALRVLSIIRASISTGTNPSPATAAAAGIATLTLIHGIASGGLMHASGPFAISLIALSVNGCRRSTANVNAISAVQGDTPSTGNPRTPTKPAARPQGQLVGQRFQD